MTLPLTYSAVMQGAEHWFQLYVLKDRAISKRLMERAHLAVTPGRDFGVHAPERFLRFSTANSMEQLQESVRRLRGLLG